MSLWSKLRKPSNYKITWRSAGVGKLSVTYTEIWWVLRGKAFTDHFVVGDVVRSSRELYRVIGITGANLLLEPLCGGWSAKFHVSRCFKRDSETDKQFKAWAQP